MCTTLKGISHREVLNAASREANGIKMLQRTRDSCAWRILILQATGHVTMLHSPLYVAHFKSGLNSGEAQHKIALIFYTMVKNQVEYDESIWATRDAHREKRFEMKLKRQAKQLGYQLDPIEHKAA
jgi:hypothetical protein